MTTPPKANPTIASVNGSDASARGTANSACTGGSGTTTDHMPTPPMVEISLVAARRSQAWAEAGRDSGLALFIDYHPKGRFNAFDLVGIKQLLESELGIDVDITTRDGPHPMLRTDIEQSAF